MQLHIGVPNMFVILVKMIKCNIIFNFKKFAAKWCDDRDKMCRNKIILSF